MKGKLSMTILSDAYLTKLRTLHADVSDTYERLNRMLSAVDKEISNIYHNVERIEFDGESAYAAITLLQDALHRRRAVKDELSCVRPLMQLFANNVDDMNARYRKAVSRSEEMRGPVNLVEFGGFDA